MTKIVDTIDEAIAVGHRVYVRCWGGVGGTGIVVRCYLVRHVMTGAQALDELAHLWQQTEKSRWKRRTPGTGEQAQMVRDWEKVEAAS